MSEREDRKLGMDRNITRRDFLNGVAVGTGGAVAGSMLPGFAWETFAASISAQDQPGYYPPALTGLRGSHVGSFEVAHGVRDGNFPAKGAEPKDTKEDYDLVIAGGGISGLSAAYFWRAKNPNARILILDKCPLTEQVRHDILRLETEAVDYFPELSSVQKKDRLSRISYKNFLLNVVKLNPHATPYYQTRTHGLFGVGIDGVSALDCWALMQPGFKGLKLEPGPYSRMGYTPMGFASPKEPYEFHFPDGNATIARMLVRRMIPAAASGDDAQDIVMAKFDYSQLDKLDSQVRIRLSSIVVAAQHAGNAENATHADVTYVREGRLSTVHGKNVIMACWNVMIPYLCPELPEKQKEALKYGVKVPLVYTAVAIRNWKVFEKIGVHTVACPGMYHYQMNLDLPVDIGGYESPKKPDEPILVRMERTPCLPGLSERDQHRAGRGDLLSTPFDTFERSIRDQFARVLGEGGFDPANDITAITVNRWPHGYAYEYNYLFDPEWPKGESPCEIGRKRFGRIAIANSDAGAAAYTDQAMDQAWRAVEELHTA